MSFKICQANQAFWIWIWERAKARDRERVCALFLRLCVWSYLTLSHLSDKWFSRDGSRFAERCWWETGPSLSGGATAATVMEISSSPPLSAPVPGSHWLVSWEAHSDFPIGSLLLLTLEVPVMTVWNILHKACGGFQPCFSRLAVLSVFIWTLI